MYKLFLCLRYLRSKAFAYFGMLCVALSVCLMLISVSVFTGFLNKIEKAAKGLFGDIIIQPYGERGFAYYDEFIDEMKQKVPEVEAADPFILTMGMLGVEGDNDFRQRVMITGIRLPDRAEVTDFEQGLFVQDNTKEPTFNVSLEDAVSRLEVYKKYLRGVVEGDFSEQLAKLTPRQREACFKYPMFMRQHLAVEGMSEARLDLLRRLSNAFVNLNDAVSTLQIARNSAGDLKRLRKEFADAKKRGATMDEQDDIEEKIEELETIADVKGPGYRVILGLGIPGLAFRTEKGQTIRSLLPGHNVFLYLVPLGKRFTSEGVQPTVRKFTVIDDACSGVHSIDSEFVYVPFDTLQTLNNMGEEVSSEDGEVVVPKRCSQIHVKVNNPKPTELDLLRVAGRIKELWGDFRKRYPQAATSDVGIETWRQRQAHLVVPLENQRTLVIIVIAVIWIVVVVLVFVIFYTIVTQKTREIGVLKAIGAGGWGVAGVFLGYGAVVGLIGSIFGLLGGWAFIYNINAIQDWVDATFGYRVWSRESFMFDMIPNEVDWHAAIFIVVSSILAGLVGAMLPAIRAARMQPVEALRYE